MDNLFRERIESRRGGITQKEYAKWLGVPHTTYTNWINGVSSPKAEAIIDICLKLNVSADWLLGLKEKKGGVSATNSTVAAYGSSVTGGDCARCPLMQAAKAAMSNPPSRRARR